MKPNQKRESGLICAKLKPESHRGFHRSRARRYCKNLEIFIACKVFSISSGKIGIVKVLQKPSDYSNSERHRSILRVSDKTIGQEITRWIKDISFFVLERGTFLNEQWAKPTPTMRRLRWLSFRTGELAMYLWILTNWNTCWRSGGRIIWPWFFVFFFEIRLWGTKHS